MSQKRAPILRRLNHLLMFVSLFEGKANLSRTSLLDAKSQLASSDRNLYGSEDGDRKRDEGINEDGEVIAHNH